MRNKKLAIIHLAVVLVFACRATGALPGHVQCTGKVIDGQAQPVADVKVVMYEMVSDGVAGNIKLHNLGEVITTDEGAFVFAAEPRPASGTFMDGYIVATKQGLSLGWAIWGMHENADVVVELREPERLKGVIVDEAGQPIVGAEVRANLLRAKKTITGEDKKEWLPGIAPIEWLGAKTDNQGRFQFDNIPADSGVDLLVTAKGKATVYTYQSKVGPSFKAGQTNIKLTVPEEGRITGRILDPDTAEGVPGAKFAVVATYSSAFYYRFVCTSGKNGAFSLAGLQSGEYLIRGEGLPNTYIVVKSGQATQITIRANKLWYGRVLFEDGSPALVKPAPWPGAKTSISLSEDNRLTHLNIAEVDDDGYFRVHFSDEQIQRLQARKAWLYVNIPISEGNNRETVFPVDLLATEKNNAGAVKIVRPAAKPSSLIGKALPPLDQIGLDAGGGQIKDKIVLVGFFDMNQRPSRYCVLQLAKQAGQLQEKGIMVVAIQASKADEDTLNEWIKKNAIRFPVGMIRTDEDETRFAWGVKSLPWLILTNPDHIVTAEGFGLKELDGKINEAARAQPPPHP
jgi:hypothetical protein